MVEPAQLVDTAVDRPRMGPDDEIWCPVDRWAFKPYFTDGVCPICGWEPRDVDVDQPWNQRIDPIWPALALLMVVSVVMLILVLIAVH